MSWCLLPLQWLNTTEVNLAKNLDLLLDSNPVISSQKSTRPTGVKDLREWIKNKVFTEFIDTNLRAYRNNTVFQDKLETFITDLLAKQHYLYMLRASSNSSFQIVEKQFWFPPTYYVCNWKQENGQVKYFKMYFLREDFFDAEFYRYGEARKHPAIVIKRVSENFFWMVPFTSRDGDGKLRVVASFKDGSKREQYAIYKFIFKVCSAMLNDEAVDRRRMTILDTDFDSIVNKVKPIS